MIEDAAHFGFFLATLHMHDLTAAEVTADLLDRIERTPVWGRRTTADRPGEKSKEYLHSGWCYSTL
jgi:hypothetical protein